jgi:hypothetical protein
LAPPICSSSRPARSSTRSPGDCIQRPGAVGAIQPSGCPAVNRARVAKPASRSAPP